MSVIKITDKESMGKDEWWCNWYKCPNCKEESITESFDYCPNCGYEIKWDLKEEE